jgi:hypothetical protein
MDKPITIKILNADILLEWAQDCTKSEFMDRFSGKIKGDPNEAYKIVKAQAKLLAKPSKAKKKSSKKKG